MELRGGNNAIILTTGMRLSVLVLMRTDIRYVFATESARRIGDASLKINVAEAAAGRCRGKS